ncbi:zinc finger CCHC domain-containing protein 7 isoform X2 [Echeneis naucrates]|uniref:Zinc finger CCHC domain-containing protein 7 n=1 Tax=Echeneis naucrates TaxID=173247 RepID=A0A665WQX3_ECHNA|nr:zinc finger CCHC domain-containing protein 7 isoform X2 [Echeneis naucrates]
MYSDCQDHEELENELYQEDDGDSDGSEANSELEFHLYSQLHYSSNAGEMEVQERGENAGGHEGQQVEVTDKTSGSDGDQENTGDNGPKSPNTSKPRRCLKKRKEGEKSDKQKRGKHCPKDQTLSSSLFEEVIVIDSSPEVISVSDDDDTAEDQGVCALKGQSAHQLQTSTPVHQVDQLRKRNFAVPVTVVSSSSESDSEESESTSESDSSDSSDSADSDCLENWMILGRGKQDGDQSISLNLEGGSDSNADAEEEDESSWLVSDKDKEAQIYNKDKRARIVVQRMTSRYYTGKNVNCRNCNKTGHLSKNCPEPKKLLPCFICGTPGHVVSECPNRHCNNCGLPGHLYESCSERAYWHKQCHRCNMTGHFFDACPQIWRQYHITTETGPPVKKQKEDKGRSPAYCYNCSRKGHFGHACTKQRMFNGVFASIPFISHYDSVEDIKSRQHRIKLKVQDLRKNGYFPTTSGTPVTPGPPKKKQKLNHHKNNHQPNHTPHQTPNNHKTSRSHIFFSDSDFRNATPKTNKLSQNKEQKSTDVKRWKPKRPVPTLRDPLPPAKLIFDEADDFPRGGGHGEKKDKKQRKGRKAGLPSKGQRHSRSHTPWTGARQGSEVMQENGEKRKKRTKRRARDRKMAEKERSAPMYPTDENLFIIKQRRRKR